LNLTGSDCTSLIAKCQPFDIQETCNNKVVCHYESKTETVRITTSHTIDLIDQQVTFTIKSVLYSNSWKASVLTASTNYPQGAHECPGLGTEIEKATDALNWKPSRPAEFIGGVGLNFDSTPLLTCRTYRLSWTMSHSIEIVSGAYVSIVFPPEIDLTRSNSSQLNILIISGNKIIGTTRRNYLLGFGFEFSISGIRLPYTETEFNTIVETYTNKSYEEEEMVHRSHTKKVRVEADSYDYGKVIKVSPSSPIVGEISTYTITFQGSCSDIRKPRVYIVAPSVFTANSKTCTETDNCNSNLPFITLELDSVLTANTPKTLSFRLVNPPSEKPVSGSFEITVYEDTTSTKAFKAVGRLSDEVTFTAGRFNEFKVIQENKRAGESLAYTFTFDIRHKIPRGGYFSITLNENIGLTSLTSIYINNEKTTYTIHANIVKIKVLNDIETSAVIVMEKLRNPIVLGSYSGITAESSDPESYKIDISNTLNIEVTEPGIGELAINIENPMNLAETKYEFTFTSPNFNMPFEELNYLHIHTPSKLQCKGLVAGSSNLSPHSGDAYNFVVTGESVKALKFSMTCVNPEITTPTSEFKASLYSSSKSNILVGSSTSQTTIGSSLSSCSLSCNPICPRCSSSCTITFTRINTLPIKTIAIHSSSLDPNHNTCNAIMPSNPSSTCSYDSASNSLLLTFSATTPTTSFNIGKIMVINPDYDAKEASKFSIKTYNTINIDANYLIDQSNNVGVLPVLCNYPCLECETDSPNLCTICTKDSYSNSFYYLYTDLKECQLLGEENNCGTGYYKDKANYKCVKCHSSCVECINVATYCTKCPLSTYAYQGKCLTICPDGTYPDTDKGVCKECFEGCTKCSNSATYCSECKAGYLYYNYNCLEKCPTKTFPSGNNCEPCSDECLTCSSSARLCTSCGARRYLLRTSCITKEECDKDNEYIADDNRNECLACKPPCSRCLDNVGKCLKCTPNTFLYNSECLLTCPGGYYGKEGLCLKCNSPCATCHGSDDTCHSCIDGMYWLPDKYSCVVSCSPEYYVFDRACIRCESPCKTCENSAITCKSCVQNYYLHESKCLSQCPSNTYIDVNTCVLCDPSCLTCQYNRQMCTSCASDRYINENTCVDECPKGKFEIEGTCKVCNIECSTCSGAANFCLSCTKGKYAYGGTCLDVCPLETIADESNNACVSCGIGCNVCRWNELGKDFPCVKCSNDYKYLSDKCYYVCPDDYIVSSDELECVKAREEGSGEYLPFPHLIIAGLLGMMVAVGQSRDGRALVVSNLIVVINYATISSYVLQVVWAGLEEEMVVITVTVISIALQLLLNIVFFFYFKRLTREDMGYQTWSSIHNCTNKSILGLSTIFTLQNARFFYSRFMGFAVFFAKFSNIESILHSLNAFSVIQILIVHCVIIVLDIIGLFKLEQGTKLYVNIIESLILSFILIILLYYEMRNTSTIKDDIENENSRYSRLKDSSTAPSLKAIDEERIRKDILEIIFKEIGMSANTSVIADSELDNSFKLKKRTVKPKRRGSFSELSNTKEKDPRVVRSYPCSPKTAKRKDLVVNLAIPEIDPAKLPNNVYSDSVSSKKPMKAKTLVEFGVQTHPFQKLEMFRKHLKTQRKKNRRLFELDQAARPLEVIQEALEDNDELINEKRGNKMLDTTEAKDYNDSEVKATELKSVVVLDKSALPLKDINTSANTKEKHKTLEEKIIVSFPIKETSIGDRDNSKGIEKRPNSPPQNCKDQKESISKPLDFSEESKLEILKDKKTLATSNKLPDIFEDDNGYKFTSAKLKDSLAKDNEELWINDDEIMGVFDNDPKDGCILIMENQEGVLVDRRGKVVNKYGYLIDKNGNIVNQEGKFVMSKEEFEKELEEEPQLQNNNLFKEIAPNKQKSSDRITFNHPKGIDKRLDEDNESETRKSASLDSLMDDTPSNYNIQNQRYNDPLTTEQHKGKLINKLKQYVTKDKEHNKKSVTKKVKDRAFEEIDRKYSFDIAEEIEEQNNIRVKFNNIDENQEKPKTARNNFKRKGEDIRRAKSRKKEDELDKAYKQNVQAMFIDPEESLSVISATPSTISHNDCKIRGLEVIYLQRLESSSKHNKKVGEKNKKRKRIKKSKPEKGNQENRVEHDEISLFLADNFKAMEMKSNKASDTEHELMPPPAIARAAGNKLHCYKSNN